MNTVRNLYGQEIPGFRYNSRNLPEINRATNNSFVARGSSHLGEFLGHFSGQINAFDTFLDMVKPIKNGDYVVFFAKNIWTVVNESNFDSLNYRNYSFIEKISFEQSPYTKGLKCIIKCLWGCEYSMLSDFGFQDSEKSRLNMIDNCLWRGADYYYLRLRNEISFNPLNLLESVEDYKTQVKIFMPLAFEFVTKLSEKLDLLLIHEKCTSEEDRKNCLIKSTFVLENDINRFILTFTNEHRDKIFFNFSKLNEVPEDEDVTISFDSLEELAMKLERRINIMNTIR